MKMSEGKFTCIMFIVVPTLCDSIKNYFNISYKEARNLLYHSKLYKALEKQETKLTGKEVYELFEKYGVLKYLHDGYDMLHTQGDGWLMNDIKEFLKIRGYLVS